MWHAFLPGDERYPDAEWTGEADTPQEAATTAAQTSKAIGEWMVFTGPLYRVNVVSIISYEATSTEAAEAANG